jgi:isoleucyl-tRNA synthetase
MADDMYHILVKSQDRGLESVHLEEYPNPNLKMIKPKIEGDLEIAREVITLGRSIRAKKDLKVRWPLQKVVIVTNKTGEKAVTAFKTLIMQELNVKALEFSNDPLSFQDIEFAPQFKKLGPKFKKNANAVAKWMKAQKGSDSKEIAQTLEETGEFVIEIEGKKVTISSDDLEVRITEKEGYSGSPFKEGDLFLNLEMTSDLIQEGFVRDLIRRIQSMRKDLELIYDAEIELNLTKLDVETKEIVKTYSELIKQEVLASKLDFTSKKKGFKKDWIIQDPEEKNRNITINIKSEL